MAIEKKIYAVEVGGKTLFVKAQTTRGAVKNLGSAIAREAEKSVRLLDAAQLLEIIQAQGMPAIVDTDEAEPGTEGSPQGGAGEAGAAQTQVADPDDDGSGLPD